MKGLARVPSRREKSYHLTKKDRFCTGKGARPAKKREDAGTYDRLSTCMISAPGSGGAHAKGRLANAHLLLVNRFRTNMARIRESRPDSGLGFKVEVLRTF